MTIKTITDNHTERILAHLDNANKDPDFPHPHHRTKLLFLLMLDAGLRVAETASLDILDLTTEGHSATTLHVRSDIAKGRHPRDVPISHRLAIAIETYFAYHHHQTYPNEHHYAFPGPGITGHLTTRGIHKIINKTSIRATGDPLHPHALRHTFATRLMRTSNIRVVQTLLGHKNLASTQIYTHPDAQDLRSAIESLSVPRPSPQ